MQIVRYTPDHRAEWDAFVRGSKNGTFLFRRDYMDYHADRFADCSFLFYEKGKLIAVLPANLRADEHTLYSHQGLTYGGLVMGTEIRAAHVLGLFDEWLDLLRTDYGVRTLVYKPVPHIYHRHPAEEDLYALFRHRAVLRSRLLSSVIDRERPIAFTYNRRWQAKKALKEGLRIERSEQFGPFWEVLTHRLQQKYGVNPVHSLEEIERLRQAFPEEIVLLEARMADEVVGGCVHYITDEVVHIQYAAATEAGMALGALDALFYHTATEFCPEKRYIDIGNSNEQGGWVLNENLIFRKETCGARGIVFDTYELTL